MTLFQGNRDLLDAFRAGEASALKDVYLNYAEKIEIMVAHGWFDPKSQSRARGIADFEIQAELIQEIFMRAFTEKARLSYDGIRPYKVFLVSIARNVIVDYIRKQPRDALSHTCVVDEAYLIDNVSGDPGETEDDLDWQRCIRATEAYVRTLDAARKEFISLRFKQELPLLEVSRRMGITRGKARFMEKDLGRSLKKHLQAMNLTVNFRK